LTSKSSQNIDIDSLTTLFTSKARALVLRALLVDPRRSYYQRQLEMATELAIRAVQRELERLTQVGLLYRWTEGKRAYYSVDREHPTYAPLRGLVLATLEGVDRLHAELADDPDVRLAFVDGSGGRVLIVTDGDTAPGRWERPGLGIEVMNARVFAERLANEPDAFAAYLNAGEDLLGRRDDILWRRIESAGFEVRKRKGTP
jgi:hypothetical protein